MHIHFFKLLIFSFFFVSCGVQTPTIQENKVNKLAQTLQTLHTNISHTEAMRLSRDIYQKTVSLSKEFQLTAPPSYHNFLVNVGLKEKGLCYHWSDALYLHFMQSNYPSFEFHLVGANIGEYWSEHNSLVIVAKEMPIESGLIIDPWRNSGELYFSKVKEDTKYHWVHRQTRGCSR